MEKPTLEVYMKPCLMEHFTVPLTFHTQFIDKLSISEFQYTKNGRQKLYLVNTSSQ